MASQLYFLFSTHSSFPTLQLLSVSLTIKDKRSLSVKPTYEYLLNDSPIEV